MQKDNIRAARNKILGFSCQLSKMDPPFFILLRCMYKYWHRVSTGKPAYLYHEVQVSTQPSCTFVKAAWEG